MVPGLRLGSSFCHQRFVGGLGSKGDPGLGSISSTFCFFQLLHELVMHDLQAFEDRRAVNLGRVDGQGALEVVDDRDQGLDQGLVGELHRLVLLSFQALAHVL